MVLGLGDRAGDGKVGGVAGGVEGGGGKEGKLRHGWAEKIMT